MTILKIIETLQIYSEDFIAYKLDGQFANAVTEAVALLIGQGERIADLENELREERHRHDRYVDFELAEAEELRKLKERSRWIPVTERLPDIGDRCLCNVKSFAFPGSFYHAILPYDKYGFVEGGIYTDDVTHWMPLPEPPKEG